MQLECFSATSGLLHIFQKMTNTKTTIAKKHSITIQINFKMYVIPINCKQKTVTTVNDFQFPDVTYHRTRDSSTDTRSPCTINLMSCCSSSQTSHKQYHESNSCHRGANYYKDDLNGINPRETQSEDGVKHNDGQSRSPIHRPTKYAHPNETHYCGY